MHLSKIFQNVGVTNSIAELLTLILVILCASGIFWLLIGRFRLHNFLINTYIAFALVQVVPKDILSLTEYSSIILFLILVTFLTLANRYLFDIHQYGSGLSIWQLFVMSFLEIMLLIDIICYFLPAEETLKYVSSNYISYFTDIWWRILWMIIPLLFLIFVKKRQ